VRKDFLSPGTHAGEPRCLEEIQQRGSAWAGRTRECVRRRMRWIRRGRQKALQGVASVAEDGGMGVTSRPRPTLESHDVRHGSGSVARRVGGTQKRTREDAGASEEGGRREGVSWARLPGVAAGENPSLEGGGGGREVEGVVTFDAATRPGPSFNRTAAAEWSAQGERRRQQERKRREGRRRRPSRCWGGLASSAGPFLGMRLETVGVDGWRHASRLRSVGGGHGGRGGGGGRWSRGGQGGRGGR